MKMIGKKSNLLLMTAICISASGCAPQYGTPQEAAANACRAVGPRALSGALIGGLGGAAGGAAIGGAAGGGRGAAIGAGAGLLLGVLSGLAVGHQLDQNDCASAQVALQKASTSAVGYTASWTSPTGSHGSFTPIGESFSQKGRICRQIRSDVQIQGHQPVEDNAITCRTDSGDWERVDKAPG